MRGSLIDEVVAGYHVDPTGRAAGYTFHHDQVNSVVGLSDHTGAVSEASRYSPFGLAYEGGVDRFVLDGGGSLAPVVSFPGLGESVLVADWDGQPGDEARVVGVDSGVLTYRFPIGAESEPPVTFGSAASHEPVVGDWDGDGTLNAGVVARGGVCGCLYWYLDLRESGPGVVEFGFGAETDRPIVGDWDGDGTTNVGVGKDQGGGFEFHLNTDNQSGLFASFAFGQGGDLPVAGDWDGDGTTDVGVLRDVGGQATFLLDTDGVGGAAEQTVTMEGPLGKPIAGVWDGSSGPDRVGMQVPRSTSNPLRYTGRVRDPQTGLYYYRARFYDPEIGRFLSEDPLGFGAGDVNLYAYVGNNPVNFGDPSGKCPAGGLICAGAAIAAAGTIGVGVPAVISNAVDFFRGATPQEISARNAELLDVAGIVGATAAAPILLGSGMLAAEFGTNLVLANPVVVTEIAAGVTGTVLGGPNFSSPTSSFPEFIAGEAAARTLEVIDSLPSLPVDVDFPVYPSSANTAHAWQVYDK